MEKIVKPIVVDSFFKNDLNYAGYIVKDSNFKKKESLDNLLLKYKSEKSEVSNENYEEIR